MSDCVFCKIIRGEIPGKFIHRDPEWVAFYDIHPKAPVHVLIIPVSHIESVAQVHDSDCELMGKLLLASKKIAEKLKINKDGFKLIINNGRGAGQMVYHLHIHLLGGWGKNPEWQV